MSTKERSLERWTQNLWTPTNYEEAQKLRKHPRDEIIDDELLDEYRNLNDENSSIGRLKLPDDNNLLNIEGR